MISPTICLVALQAGEMCGLRLRNRRQFLPSTWYRLHHLRSRRTGGTTSTAGQVDVSGALVNFNPPDAGLENLDSVHHLN